MVFSCWLDIGEIIIYNDMAEKVSKMNWIVLPSVMTIYKTVSYLEGYGDWICQVKNAEISKLETVSFHYIHDYGDF